MSNVTLTINGRAETVPEGTVVAVQPGETRATFHTPSNVTLTINGRAATVPEGTVVAVAIARAGVTAFRRSVNASERGPLCGMGLCGECRVTINGRAHQRSCQTLCASGMEVITDAV